MDGLTPKWGQIGSGRGAASQNTDGASRNTSRRSKKRESPLSLRLSFEEKQQLVSNAGRQSVSAYIKARLFDEDAPKRQARGLNPVKDHEALAQVLGLLGASGLSKNLGDLAEAARLGALAEDDDTRAAIRRACDDIRIMRRFLLAALGIQDTAGAPDVKESCSSTFNRKAVDPDTLSREEEPEP